MNSENAVFGRNRVALVTGGSSGIGLAVGRLLARQGCHVWLVARNEDRLSAALSEIKAARQSDEQVCGALSADVSDPQQAGSAVEQVTRVVGSPHLLINSAGVARPGYFQEISLEDFPWMMNINYLGTVYTIKAVLPGMLERGWGHIVNISSVAGFMSVYGYTAYCASKFAVTGFSEVLRAELRAKGIGVSIVYPPDVDTPQLAYESQFRPAETRAMLTGNPVLSADSVAAAILRGVSRRQYTIVPGVFAQLMYWVTHILGRTAYPVMDWMAARGTTKTIGTK